MIDEIWDKEFEMPTPCQKCGEIFDLNDGIASIKWFPNTVICQKCGDEEEKEVEQDEEIDDLKSQIDDANYTIKEALSRLKDLGVDVPFIYDKGQKTP